METSAATARDRAEELDEDDSGEDRPALAGGQLTGSNSSGGTSRTSAASRLKPEWMKIAGPRRLRAQGDPGQDHPDDEELGEHHRRGFEQVRPGRGPRMWNAANTRAVTTMITLRLRFPIDFRQDAAESRVPR